MTENENQMLEQNEQPLTLDDALQAARAEMNARETEESTEEYSDNSSKKFESSENQDFQNDEASITENGENFRNESAENVDDARISENISQYKNQSEGDELAILRQQLAQQNQMLAQYQAQLAQQAQQMQVLSKSASEANSANAAEVVQQLMTPPELDFGAIMYADEETQKAATRKFVDDTVNYARDSIMRELAPVVGEYKAREAEARRISAKDKYRNNAQFEGFSEREPWIEQILQKNPELQGLPLEKQYEIAYLITQGVDNIKAKNAPPPPEPAPKSVDERLAEVENDSELMRALEARRVRNAAQRSGDAHPAFTASGGNSRVSLNVPDEPNDFESARSQALSRFLGRG